MTVLPSLIQLADCRPFAECGFLQHNHQCLCRLRRTIQQPSPSGLRCPVNGIWENIIISIIGKKAFVNHLLYHLPQLGHTRDFSIIYSFEDSSQYPPSGHGPRRGMGACHGAVDADAVGQLGAGQRGFPSWLVRAKAGCPAFTDLGLSENRVPLDPMVYHLLPYQNAILLGYAIFTRIYMVSWLALPEWVGLLI